MESRRNERQVRSSLVVSQLLITLVGCALGWDGVAMWANHDMHLFEELALTEHTHPMVEGPEAWMGWVAGLVSQAGWYGTRASDRMNNTPTRLFTTCPLIHPPNFRPSHGRPPTHPPIFNKNHPHAHRRRGRE